MNAEQQWRACPQRIEVDDGERRVVLEKHARLFALRGDVPQALARDVTHRLDEGVVIVRAPPSGDDAIQVNVLPVYTAGAGSPPAVASGRLFVRLERGSEASSWAGRFEPLGLVIEEVPAYAPNCAWLAPRSGIAAHALRSLDALRALPGVAHAEPELLRQLSLKLP